MLCYSSAPSSTNWAIWLLVIIIVIVLLVAVFNVSNPSNVSNSASGAARGVKLNGAANGMTMYNQGVAAASASPTSITSIAVRGVATSPALPLSNVNLNIGGVNAGQTVWVYFTVTAPNAYFNTNISNSVWISLQQQNTLTQVGNVWLPPSYVAGAVNSPLGTDGQGNYWFALQVPSQVTASNGLIGYIYAGSFGTSFSIPTSGFFAVSP